jgi:uncharacterized protein Smg (DUF494 family)
MAHLKTKETKRDAEARKEWKFRLTRRLYEQGYERQDILNLFRFLDWLMALPEGLKQAFQSGASHLCECAHFAGALRPQNERFK